MITKLIPLELDPRFTYDESFALCDEFGKVCGQILHGSNRVNVLLPDLQAEDIFSISNRLREAVSPELKEPEWIMIGQSPVTTGSGGNHPVILKDCPPPHLAEHFLSKMPERPEFVRIDNDKYGLSYEFGEMILGTDDFDPKPPIAFIEIALNTTLSQEARGQIACLGVKAGPQ